MLFHRFAKGDSSERWGTIRRNHRSPLCLGYLVLLLVSGNLPFALGTTARRSLFDGQDPHQVFKQRQHKLQKQFDTVGHEHQATSGRGIVITAGGRRQLTNTFVVIKVIREALNSNLPIEIYFDGAGEADLEVFGKLQEVSGVFLRDASLLTKPAALSPWPKQLHGYAKKIFSLHTTRFQQVLLLDSDSQPLVKPDLLFELDEFKRFGNVFWPDYWDGSNRQFGWVPRPEAYSLLGLPDPRDSDPNWFCVESGQVLFDKGKHADVLDWVMWINMQSDITYQHMLGDKDTFQMGFMLSNKHDQFYRLPTPPRAALTEEKGSLHFKVGMVQSVNGHPAFLHRTMNVKFDSSKPEEDHHHPAYFTEPITSANFHFSTDHQQILRIDTAKVQSSLPACDHLSQATLKALGYHLFVGDVKDRALETAKRYAKCTEFREGDSPVPLPVLPISLFGQSLVHSVEYGFAAFKELRSYLHNATTDTG